MKIVLTAVVLCFSLVMSFTAQNFLFKKLRISLFIWRFICAWH